MRLISARYHPSLVVFDHCLCFADATPSILKFPKSRIGQREKVPQVVAPIARSPAIPALIASIASAALPVWGQGATTVSGGRGRRDALIKFLKVAHGPHLPGTGA
jgi:hypothetical protein